MSTSLIALLLSTLALVVAFYCFSLVSRYKKQAQLAGDKENFSTRPLQLQAYERLVMLSERIAIPNLVSRANQPGFNARDMQMLLIESIKQEFEYNASQQIYVSPVAWEAVNNLKEQNMLIINQVGSTLPPDSTGMELNKRLLEFVMTQKKGALHSIVLEALNFEAKKLMK
jgi:hypothetical protein